VSDEEWMLTLYERYVQLYGDPDKHDIPLNDPSRSAMNQQAAQRQFPAEPVESIAK